MYVRSQKAGERVMALLRRLYARQSSDPAAPPEAGASGFRMPQGALKTVGARKLLDILRALPEGAEVTLTLQDKRLQVKSGKSRFNLQTLPPEAISSADPVPLVSRRGPRASSLDASRAASPLATPPRPDRSGI